MLINISSDFLFISYDGVSLQMPRGNLEVELPKYLKRLHDSGVIAHRIYVINGPGSFTNMRVCCLCLNMYKDIQKLSGIDIKLYTLDKIALYTALYTKLDSRSDITESNSQINVIQGKGLIYIGQQKNARSLNEKAQIGKVPLDPSDNYDWLDCYSECIKDKRTVNFTLNNDMIHVSGPSGDGYFKPEVLGFIQVDQLIPHYMMEPNIQGK